MIISRTPFRVSFFGGGTDYPAWYLEHGGLVLATTIDKYAYITCRYLPPFFDHRYRIVYSRIEIVKEISDIEHPAAQAVLRYLDCKKGVEVHYDGDLPARSGVGSSSAFTVGLLNAVMALCGKHVSKEELAVKSTYIEQEMIRESVGSQDQVSAAFGGFNRIEFKTNGMFDVTPIILPKSRLDELESHLLLFFTGSLRTASEIAKSKIDNLKNHARELTSMYQMVDEAIKILQKDNAFFEDFGRLLHQSWQCKRSLSPLVSNSKIDEIYEEARRAGAGGGKLLGAGGGGFLLLFVKPELQEKVRETMRHFLNVPFRFENSGSKIILYQPNGSDS